MEEEVSLVMDMVSESTWSNVTLGDEFDMNEYLEQYLGPKNLPYSSLIPMTIIYVLILLTGIFGNVTTCVVIITNQYMHTATNYYLFNLAMADMTTLVVGKYTRYLYRYSSTESSPHISPIWTQCSRLNGSHVFFT